MTHSEYSRHGSFSFDEVVRLMEVFSDDNELRNWFRSLQDMTEPNRAAHLQSMMTGMRTACSRPELISVLESLISPATVNDALQTVRDIDTD